MGDTKLKIMIRVKIKAYETALVYQKGKLTQVLTEGKYFLPFSSQVVRYDMFDPFYSELDFDILLQNETLASMLDIVEVADYEIALQFEKGRLVDVLKTGEYAYFKEVTNYTYKRIDMRDVNVDETLDEIIWETPK